MKALTIFRNLFLVVLALVFIAILVLAGIILYDTVFPAQRVENLTNVSYTAADGTSLSGYLAQPAGNGPHPAVLMIHEFYGLNEEMVKKADLLAKQGYVVLAPDAYRGKTTSLVPRAIFLTVTTSREQIAGDIDAAYNYLVGQQAVDRSRVGVVGFCFGGTQALQLGIRNRNLAANVIFYGSGLITAPEQLGELGQKGPVLAIFGETDNSIPLDEVRAFEQAMQARQITHDVTIYPEVGHAFVSYEGIFEPGAAQQAWQEMERFLRKNLLERAS